MNRVTNIEVLAVEIEEKQGKKSTYKKMEVAYKALNTFTKKVEIKTAHLVDFVATPELWNALADAKKGDTLLILETKDDKYWNFSGIAGENDKGDQSQVASNSYSRPSQDNNDSRQKSIQRQSSLAQAVQFVNKHNDEPVTVDTVLAIAEQFEDWVNR
jgi:hypothetical protein